MAGTCRAFTLEMAATMRRRQQRYESLDTMAKTSAGLLMYRIRNDQLEVLLVHLGGPFWAKKDEKAWFVPKGELAPGENELDAAKREFREETGLESSGELIPLGTVRHKGGKIVHAWAFQNDCDPSSIKSNIFTMEWPPRSGNRQAFPEIGRARFFSVRQARTKIHPPEFEFIERLKKICVERGVVQCDESHDNRDG